MEKSYKKDASLILKEIFYLYEFSPGVLISDLYVFFPKKISYDYFFLLLKKLQEKKIIFIKNDFIYLKISDIKKSRLHQNIAKKKLCRRSFKIFLFLLSCMPVIKYCGISGSLAYGRAKESDDIDLFIITAGNFLWTARFTANIIALICGVKRKRGLSQAPDKVCLNLFFSESRLSISKDKQTEFVAREIIKLKTVFDKKDIYKDFILKNLWILKFFPNFRIDITDKDRTIASKDKVSNIFIYFESLLRKLQILFMKRDKIRDEIISDTQLWFFPEDFTSRYIKLRKRAGKKAILVASRL